MELTPGEWITLASVFVALISAILAFITYKVYKQQEHILRAQLEIQTQQHEKQTEILELQLAEARNEAVRLERQTESETFCEIRLGISAKRGSLCRRARALYAGQARYQISEPDFPLLVREGWLAGEPVELRPPDEDASAVSLQWLEVPVPNPFSLHNVTLPHNKSGYVDCIREFCRDVKLEDRAAYRIVEFAPIGPRFRMTFAGGFYFDYVNHCEVLAHEFASEALNKPDNITLNTPLRDALDPFDFTNRFVGVGINTLLVIKGRTKQNSLEFLVHSRSGRTLEAMETVHVVPAGTFQPDGFRDGYHDRDFSIWRTVMREFAEELLGQKEVDEEVINDKDFLDHPDTRGVFDAFRADTHNACVWFMGAGLDPLTTKCEVLTLMTVDVRTLRGRSKTVWQKLIDTYEGAHRVMPFNLRALEGLVHDERTLAAGAACFSLGVRHHDWVVGRLTP